VLSVPRLNRGAHKKEHKNIVDNMLAIWYKTATDQQRRWIYVPINAMELIAVFWVVPLGPKE
jgi:hypothetical protein